jgi:signal recognition particle receptor subunit beta
MSLLDHAKGELHCKLVYWGPALSGRTTNIQYVWNRTRPGTKSTMTSLSTDSERALWFDFLPPALAPIRGLRPRFHLYTLPGDRLFPTSRVLVLKGVDGVVFVADSLRARADANVESLAILRDTLAENGLDLDRLPCAYQYNKRDLPDILPVREAVAITGVGVFDALKSVAKQILAELRKAT